MKTNKTFLKYFTGEIKTEKKTVTARSLMQPFKRLIISKHSSIFLTDVFRKR